MTVADADAPTLAWSSNMAAANVLSACLGSVDSEVAQYLAACVAQLGPEPGVQDICEQLSPFVPDLLPAERAEALAQQLSVALRVPSEPQPEPELEIQPEPQPEPQLAPQPGAELHPESEPKHRPATAGAQEEVLGQAVTRSLFLGGGGGGGDNDDDGFVVPKRRARRRRSVPQRQVSTPQPLSPQPPPQPQPSPPQPGTPPPHRNASEEIPAPAPASCGTQLGDIACSLAKYGSRKQLRRFAAELGLQADDPGGMVALLRMDSCTVRAAAAATIRGGPDQQAALMAHFQRLAAEGLPTEAAQPGPATIQRVTPAATQGSHGRAGTAAVGSQQRRTAPSECCVECHARTPYVFELRRCRLCEACERTNPSKYGVVNLQLACSMHALRERDLANVRSVVFGGGSTGGGRRKCGAPRLFLRSDVEACASRVHRQSSSRQVAAHQRAAAAEWKANSFKKVKGGKTQKWKAWNSPTYHMQQCAAKHRPTDAPEAAACVGLSGLRFVGYGE